MKSLQHQKAFTLLELLVVIAIIGLLAGIVLVQLNQTREKAEIAKAITDLEQIQRAIILMHFDTGRYPTGETEQCPALDGASNEISLNDATSGFQVNGSGWEGWNGPYLAISFDPWGNPYYYDRDYECIAETQGCDGFNDRTAPGASSPFTDSSVIVSCGPNGDIDSGSCAYDEDNIVVRFCGK